jgi:hypothetical protein
VGALELEELVAANQVTVLGLTLSLCDSVKANGFLTKGKKMKTFLTVVAAATLSLSASAFAHGGIVDLSVYDRTEGRRLQVYWHEGRAWIAGRPGNEYQVTLRSRQSQDVLAVVSVDGVNVITGQTADPSQSGYVLSPRGGLDILGWRKNLAQTAAFYFTALPDSYAARTGRPDDVGVIGVALFRRKAVSPQPFSQGAPAAAARAESSADARLGTGHGRQEYSPATDVTFERATSSPAEVITLYYDSHANLLARGIIRDPVRVAPQPRPFPGFVPDPAG